MKAILPYPIPTAPHSIVIGPASGGVPLLYPDSGVTWATGPVEAHGTVTVFEPAADPKRPTRVERVVKAPRVAELEAEIAWLDELIQRMSDYREERVEELNVLNGGSQ